MVHCYSKCWILFCIDLVHKERKLDLLSRRKLCTVSVDKNHNDIHETSSSSSTVTFCLYSIGYLVTIGCDHCHWSICIHAYISIDEKVAYLLWQNVSWMRCNMSWIFGWKLSLKPGREGGGAGAVWFGCSISLKWLFCYWILNFSAPTWHFSSV